MDVGAHHLTRLSNMTINESTKNAGIINDWKMEVE